MYMNKEVIYLEPEDDITDILTRLQQAEQKLVALVPPKKATMLRSAVNMKLVARVAKECEKIVVIVTVDPAIVKMAMAARIPVAKTLQSRPVIPTDANVKAAEAEIQVVDEETGGITDEPAPKAKEDGKMPSKAANVDSDGHAGKNAETLELTEEGLENGSETAKKSKKGDKKSKKSTSDIKTSPFSKYRKLIMFCTPAVIALVLVLVWALVFAPAATITVAISSTSSNFAENVSFTTDPAAENIAEGVFYAQKQTLEQKYSTEFEATGEEDRGDKAKGHVTFTYNFDSSACSTSCEWSAPAGSTITAYTSDGTLVRYTVDAAASMSWNGAKSSDCPSGMTGSGGLYYCKKTVANVAVTAADSGAAANIAANSRWEGFEGATIANSNAISGGTTEMVKVVSQEDADKVKDAQISEHTTEGRKMLFEDLSKDVIAIESSFDAEAGEVVATPGVGDVVGDNTKPNIMITAVFSVYTVDRSKIEQFVSQKNQVAAGQKIYTVDAPYFERFTTIEEGARLKAVVEVGPTVTEDEIFEKVKGCKTGEVQSRLKDSITGINSVEVRTPYFWVWSIPEDRSKVTINIDGEDNA